MKKNQVRGLSLRHTNYSNQARDIGETNSLVGQRRAQNKPTLNGPLSYIKVPKQSTWIGKSSTNGIDIMDVNVGNNKCLLPYIIYNN